MKEQGTGSVHVEAPVVQFGSKFKLAGGDVYFDDRATVEEVWDRLVEGQWEAPQFILRRGAELGYHCHVFRTIGEKDLGLMATMVGEDVFIEPHRKGKVKKCYAVSKIGEKEKADLILGARYELSSIPEISRRKPGKNAILLQTETRF